MQLIHLTTLLALTAALPSTTALYPWNSRLQVYDIGEIHGRVKRPSQPARTMGRCAGGDIPEGGYGCGNFGKTGTSIYKCRGGWLHHYETCRWASAGGGQCVKNQLKKGKKFYPFQDGKKVVCVQPKDTPGRS